MWCLQGLQPHPAPRESGHLQPSESDKPSLNHLLVQASISICFVVLLRDLIVGFVDAGHRHGARRWYASHGLLRRKGAAVEQREEVEVIDFRNGVDDSQFRSALVYGSKGKCAVADKVGSLRHEISRTFFVAALLHICLQGQRTTPRGSCLLPYPFRRWTDDSDRECPMTVCQMFMFGFLLLTPFRMQLARSSPSIQFSTVALAASGFRMPADK